MDIIQVILIAAGLTGVMVIGYLLLSGPSSENTLDRVESQLKKALAARKPKTHRLAGSGSRGEALAMRLNRTGRGWSVSQYLYVSGGIALVLAALLFFKTGAALLSLGIGLAVGAGLPHFLVGYFINRRINAFTTKLPDAIELLVRGLRSGLPVSETLNVVASEVPGPVGVEFKSVVERMRIGRTMEESLQETADRLGTAEFQFFVITLAIQRETGGNLAETLSNLSDVLRKRAQMKLKIRAMSSESKASAYIVGCLPFMVFGMIYWINPGYIGGFFTEERLIVAGLGGMVWMSIGAFIMAKMVSFEI
jgi:tight adherence protein B